MFNPKENIPPTNSCKSHGIMLNSHFNAGTGVKNLCCVTHFHLCDKAAIHDHLTSSATEQLIHALVSSRVDYCDFLFYGIPEYKKYLQRT